MTGSTNGSRPPRVMWLLNHSTLRAFEMRQLEALGVTEIYLPKRFPYDEGNLSASVDESRDSTLTLDRAEIDLLNAQDWYGAPTPEAWAIANRHFDVLFFAFFPRQMESVTRNFAGHAILRVFGHARGYTYSALVYQHLGIVGVERFRRMGGRFWFGQAYEHLHEIEDDFIARRSLHLPLGLRHAEVEDKWRGDDARLFFVCPRIGSSGHFATVYEQFKRDFAGVPYAVGGAQPVRVDDPRVLGYVPADVHRDNMRRFRAMYYHSSEPNHIHYHPFEAVRAGMPLVFMGGGMLDRLGGSELPGRCTTVREARRKVERLLAGDTALADAIRKAQPRLLDAMRPEACAPVWQENFGRIMRAIDDRAATASRPPRAGPLKVAVIVPSLERASLLLHALRVAAALRRGSRAARADVEIVLAAAVDASGELRLRSAVAGAGVSSRTFRWQRVPGPAAEGAARFAGYGAKLGVGEYLAMDDGINSLLDCACWIFTSDHLSLPVVPLRAVVVMTLGHPQRYDGRYPQGADAPYLDVLRRATRVWVPSGRAASDVAQYAGVPPDRVRQLALPAPLGMRVPAVAGERFALVFDGSDEAVQLRCVAMLRAYYERCGGTLPCDIVVDRPPAGAAHELSVSSQVRKALRKLRRAAARIGWCTALNDDERNALLARSRFVVFPRPADDEALYVADALRAGRAVVLAQGAIARDLSDAHPGQVCAVDLDDPFATAMALVALESRSVATGVSDAPVLDPVLDADYWRAVGECL